MMPNLKGDKLCLFEQVSTCHAVGYTKRNNFFLKIILTLWDFYLVSSAYFELLPQWAVLELFHFYANKLLLVTPPTLSLHFMHMNMAKNRHSCTAVHLNKQFLNNKSIFSAKVKVQYSSAPLWVICFVFVCFFLFNYVSYVVLTCSHHQNIFL